MDVTSIPFAKHIGIEHKEMTTLKLEPTTMVQNHIETIHASAQFALAETQSGLYLEQNFETLENKVVALLRSSSVKFKSPASSTIVAHASIDEAEKEKFLKRLERKGRATILVEVKVYDVEDVCTMQGTFTWFVQKRI